MALAVQGRGVGLVDVGGDDTIEVAPADDEAHGDAALVDAFGVVGGPDDGVGDAGVDAEGAEEGAGVANAGGCSDRDAGVSLMFLGFFKGRGPGGGGGLRGRRGERTRLRAWRSRPWRVKR